MLKVECESCKAPYQVDERRVPPAGLKMRCPKCGHSFVVTDPGKAGAQAAGAARKPPPKKATMVGLAPKAASAKAAVAPAGGAPEPPRAPAPPRPKPAGAPPSVASTPAKPAPPAGAAPLAFPDLDDLDLPALAEDVGLPAAAHRAAPKRAPAAPPASSPASKAFDFDIDLPVAVPARKPPASGKGPVALDAPAARPTLDFPRPGASAPAREQAASHADLPSPKRVGSLELPSSPMADLPSPKGDFGSLDLPVLQAELPTPHAGLPAVQADLPSPHGGAPGLEDLPIVHAPGLPATTGDGAFGEIDLPLVQNELPAIADPGAHLPFPMEAQLPMAADAFPSPLGFGEQLPMAADAFPSPLGLGEQLPMAADAFPSPLGLGEQLPSAVPDHQLAPSPHHPPPIAFGELDLPLSDEADLDPQPARGMAFGEVDLPTDNEPFVLPSDSVPPSAGGMGFGEVDLGGATDDAAPLGPPPATSAGSFAFDEAALEPARAARPEAPPGAPEVARRSSKVPKLVGIALAAAVVGGAALQLTSVGAFGYLWINDKLHASEHAADAASKGESARERLAADTFEASRAAADDLFEARKRAPRSRPLGAYAAFAEYAFQVRFGIDPARAARVSPLLAEIPAEVEVPYRAAAEAAQAAQSGDWERARAALGAAAAKEPKDGIQQELSLLRGEVALAERDPAALDAFNEAHASGASARTLFGIARAHHAARAFDESRAAIVKVLELSPEHPGALLLRAQIAWEAAQDGDAALKDLSALLGEEARGRLGPAELSSALTQRAWIMLSRDRSGEARALFEEATKIDSRNASALVGQAEVLYADGRSTEASTRFDEALAKDPSSLEALVGSAKAKIALEQLKDAKTQLTAARQKWPKEMSVALWSARAEEALGNRKEAEDLFAAAVSLSDAKDPRAVEAYAAFAKFLNAQGRTTEAAAQLEEARAKLPDSATLQRALGEVAVAQGHFQEALERFEAALEGNPADVGTRFRMGVTLRRMRELDRAAKALDEVAAIDKDYPGLALERGMLFEESGDVQKALEQFQSASQKAPDDLDLMLRVGAAYVAIGEVDKALPLLNQVKDQRPNSAEVNHFVGRAYLKQGGLESASAMRYLQRAVALDPNKAEYHLYVAWAANDAVPAQLGLARTHVDRALALDNLLGDAYWQRGVVDRKEGRIVDAIKNLKRALELRPSRHEAHATLAEAYEDRNDIAAAIVEWQRAIAGDPKPPFWRWKYGKILSERRQNAEAAKHLVYAVEHGKTAQPRPGWLGLAAFEAGEVLRRIGQRAGACDHYHLYMDLAPPTAPDRRDAIKAQSELGCPWEGAHD